MSFKPNYFKTKATPLKQIQNTCKILANRGITNYFIVESYHHFINFIKEEDIKNFYEFISSKSPVSFFLDIEIYRGSSKYFDDPDKLLDLCKNKFIKYLEKWNLSPKTIVLESHSEQKRSFHVIFKIYDNNDHDNIKKQYVFKNVKVLKELYKILGFDKFRDNDSKHIIDPSVYREGLFRTIYSSKTGESRPLVRSSYSGSDNDYDDIETFVCYSHNDVEIITLDLDRSVNFKEPIVIEPDENTENIDSLSTSSTLSTMTVNIPQELNHDDKHVIKKFVTKEFHHFPNKIRDIFIDEQYNCIIVALSERYCPFQDREHRSNNQYVVIDTSSAKQKCHDPDCNEHKYNEIRLENYPMEINEILKRCLKINQQELELIDNAIIECKNYITENFDGEVKDVSFDRKAMIFRGDVEDRNLAKILKGKCPECNVEHQISDTGYCLKCKTCQSIFPKNQIIPIDNRYKSLNNFWMNYNQLVNNGTINNIINIYNGSDIEFSCDIKLDNSIFKNKEVTNIINQVLDGHKVTMISKLVHTINKNFVYSRNNWYYFCGSIWRSDSDNIEMKKEIMDLSKLLDRIKTHYDAKHTDETTMSLNKNIKSLINKFHKPGFQDDIIKGAKIYYNDEGFISYLNSKKHLVPFTNGVFDLLSNEFRKTKKEDYINLTVNYDFDKNIDNPEVYTFLEQVLPNPGVRDYVLKKMSECLNGDIPNTYFLMFIGDSGANGKSQLLNLMKLAMGEFGEKVEVTLLTRKRNNANEANTEKIKLMNKRFAFLSEPEDGEKINIGLLKELTGSEEIVARGLYQESMSFVMEAKLFLACNELPEIKGEDTALWRRIRVIDFPSRFVDEPKEENEFKIDRTLPSRMREDPSWRQTFMKILLDYYYRDVVEPDDIKMRTNEYRGENNDFYMWMCENIEPKENNILKLQDVIEIYLGKPLRKEREKSKYKKELEKFIKEKYKSIKWEYGKVRYSLQDGDITTYGWKHLQLKH